MEAEADEYETAMQDSGMDAQRALSKFDYFTPVVRAALHQVLAIQIYERAKGPLPDEPKLATPQERVDRIIKMSKRKVLLDFS